MFTRRNNPTTTGQRGFARAAFSLLELLAVVTILGVIAAIILYRVTNVTDQAKQKVQTHQMAEINMAIEHYFMTNQVWPTSIGDLGADQLPDGVPTPPTGGTYAIDPSTHRVIVQ